ncbi:ATP-binding protein [Lysobacter arenosi]|uniref:ATP-binding protein n=1 Tax=Lysobacter arenosi TaxID=2795387 RepID=A0ABX7RDH0_9GAMM|nr:gas vesicle protein GvpD [Lysobacter arenosi]QSX75745.1 ATP-binding protein [Lysobacter arenosi]
MKTLSAAPRLEPRDCPHGHGLYQAKVTSILLDRDCEIASRCPVCAGQVRDRARQLEERDRQSRIARLMSVSGLPRRFAQADFNSYVARTKEQRDALRILRTFTEKFQELEAKGSSLLLIGGPGTGKTHLALAALRALTEREIPCFYATAASMLAGIKDHYGQRGGERLQAAAFDHLHRVRLLIIDELDVGLSEHDIGLLFRVVDGRYADLMPMVLISNRPLEQLEKSLGQRLMDRLRDCAVTVAFAWPSYRGTKGV